MSLNSTKLKKMKVRKGIIAQNSGISDTDIAKLLKAIYKQPDLYILKPAFRGAKRINAKAHWEKIMKELNAAGLQDTFPDVNFARHVWKRLREAIYKAIKQADPVVKSGVHEGKSQVRLPRYWPYAKFLLPHMLQDTRGWDTSNLEPPERNDIKFYNERSRAVASKQAEEIDTGSTDSDEDLQVATDILGNSVEAFTVQVPAELAPKRPKLDSDESSSDDDMLTEDEDIKQFVKLMTFQMREIKRKQPERYDEAKVRILHVVNSIVSEN